MSEQTTTVDVIPQFTAPKKKPGWVKWLRRLMILILIAAALVLLGRRAMARSQSTLAGSFLPTQAAAREITVAVTGTGVIQPDHTYRATAAVQGKVLSAPFAEGDRIEKGDVLFTIDPKTAEASIRQAETAVEQAALSLRSAEINYNTMKRRLKNNKTDELQDQADLAQISLENAKLALRNAQDNLSRAQDTLDNYTVTSPIGGTVVEMHYAAGDDLNLSTAAATGASSYLALIYDLSRLTFNISIDERDVGRIAVGQKVTVTADALDGRSFPGRVERVSISGSAMSGKTTYPVTVVLEGNGQDLVDQGLFPGMNVSASIIVEETGPVLTIPVDAVTRGNLVKVAGEGALDQNGTLADALKLVEREVVLGRNDDEYIEILSGLAEGETVYVEVASQSILSLMMAGRR